MDFDTVYGAYEELKENLVQKHDVIIKKDMGESPFQVATTGSLTLRPLANFVRCGVQALRFSRRGQLQLKGKLPKVKLIRGSLMFLEDRLMLVKASKLEV